MLTTHLEMRNHIHLLRLSGSLDSETLGSFKDLISPLAHQPNIRIVLDCQQLTYVNSKGLGMLGRHQRIAIRNLSFFGIAALHPRIIKTISLLGIQSLTGLYPTVETAIQAALAL